MSEQQSGVPWEAIMSLVTMFPIRQGLPELCNNIYITSGDHLVALTPSNRAKPPYQIRIPLNGGFFLSTMLGATGLLYIFPKG